MVIALALVAAGVWAIWRGMKRRRLGQQVAGWQAVQGKVLSHDIAESVSTDSDGDREWHYEPRLVYEYEAAGTVRQSQRVAVDAPSFGSRKKAQEWLDSRPVGSAVNVFVNPDDPGDSVLETAVSGNWWVAGFFIVLGIAVALGLFGD
jgi:hypothetical protein